MPKEDQADLFEADGVTLKAVEKPVITDAELKASERAARAEGENAGLRTALTAKPQKTGSEVKTFTSQELRAKVNAGEITEDQMFDTLRKQDREEITKEVRATVQAENAEKDTSTTIASYVAVFPDINREGSALRAKIEAKFQTLVKRGSPNSFATELSAIEAVCGELKTGPGRRPAPDSHEDVGAGSDGDSKPAEGWAKGLSPKLKKHYEKQIDRGIYKSHTDPRLVAELKYARARPN